MDNQPQNNQDKSQQYLYIIGSLIILIAVYIFYLVFGIETFKSISMELLAGSIGIVSGYFINKRRNDKREKQKKEEELRKNTELEKNVSEKVGDKVEDTISKALGSLKTISLDEGLAKASTLLEKCEEIRVMGTSRPSSKNKSHKRYFEETISALNAGRIKKYRRITSYYLNNELETHLKDVFSTNREKAGKNIIKVMFVSNFRQVYNYVIIGEELLLLILSSNDDDKDDYLSFYTEDKETVKSFIKNFRSVWDEMKTTKKIAKSLNDLTDILDYDKAIEESFKEIRDSMHAIQHQSLMLRHHALEEIKKNTQPFYIGLAKGYYEINNPKSINHLLRTFCIYLDQLGSNDYFKAVSFYQFWIQLLRDTPYCNFNFIESNKKALQKGADLERIFVVDEKVVLGGFTKDSENIFDNITIGNYRTDISELIKKNIDILCSFKNYKFHILFTNQHQAMRDRHKNFALIERINPDNEELTECILFEALNAAMIDDTKWVHYSKNTNKENPFAKFNDDALSFINNKKTEFIEENEVWENQEIGDLHISFLRFIDVNYFSTRTNFQKHLNLTDAQCDALGL